MIGTEEIDSDENVDLLKIQCQILRDNYQSGNNLLKSSQVQTRQPDPFEVL